LPLHGQVAEVVPLKSHDSKSDWVPNGAHVAVAAPYVVSVV